jgi:hypothetical protein
VRSKLPGVRVVGVAAVAALTAGSAFTMLAVSPAFASPPTVTVSHPSGSTTPTVVPGGTNQPGQPLLLTVTGGSVTPGDTITIAADDSDAADNCTTAGDFVAFHATPTVTDVTGSGTSATFTTASASSTACAALAGGPYKNLVVITFTNSISTTRTLAVSGITYDVGTKVTVGNLTDTVTSETGGATPGTGTGASGSPIVDANITGVIVTGNNPPTGLAPATNNQAISPIVIKETQAGQFASGDYVCAAIIQPTGSNGTTFSRSSTPTVSTTGNGSQVSDGSGGVPGNTSGTTFDPAAPAPATAVGFQVTTASSSLTQGATFTLDGLKVNTGTDTGPIVVQVARSSASLAEACATARGTAPTSTSSVVGKTIASVIVAVNRIFGADRYGTAAALFSGFGCQAESATQGRNVVLSRGDLYPDALAASYLAGSLHQTTADDSTQGTGILLTTPSALPDVTVAAMRQSGVTDVFITGQTDAVSAAVENQLKSTPAYQCGGGAQRLDANGNPQTLKVTRIGGATRYDTAQLIAQSPTPAMIGTADLDKDATPNPVRTGVIASGQNFPDALAAGPMAFFGSNVPDWYSDTGGNNAVENVSNGCNDPITWGTGLATAAALREECGGNPAGANGFPLVLTQPTALSSQAQNALLNDGIKQVILMGGTAAVSDGVATSLTNLGITVIRIGGADRYETATMLAGFETSAFNDAPAAGPNACNATGTPATCTQPYGLFFRTDHINVARGDDFADALSGGPHAGGIDAAQEPNSFEGPTPILLTDPASLSSSTASYLKAHSTPNVSSDNGATPAGGLGSADIFGGPVAVSNAVATQIQNALTGA